jgi:hypothetical protein
VPFPFLFYKYGGPIRMYYKYATEADMFIKKFHDQATPESNRSEVLNPRDRVARVERVERVRRHVTVV